MSHRIPRHIGIPACLGQLFEPCRQRRHDLPRLASVVRLEDTLRARYDNPLRILGIEVRTDRCIDRFSLYGPGAPLVRAHQQSLFAQPVRLPLEHVDGAADRFLFGNFRPVLSRVGRTLDAAALLRVDKRLLVKNPQSPGSVEFLFLKQLGPCPAPVCMYITSPPVS